MSKQAEIEAIERNIESAKVDKAVFDAFERLKNNRDFRAIITKGFMTDEAVRLVHLKGDPSMQTPERQASIVRQIDSISSLGQYFQVLGHAGAQAAKSIADGESVLEEMRKEELQ